jgi:hypothetical protein
MAGDRDRRVHRGLGVEADQVPPCARAGRQPGQVGGEAARRRRSGRPGGQEVPHRGHDQGGELGDFRSDREICGHKGSFGWQEGRRLTGKGVSDNTKEDNSTARRASVRG